MKNFLTILGVTAGVIGIIGVIAAIILWVNRKSFIGFMTLMQDHYARDNSTKE